MAGWRVRGSNSGGTFHRQSPFFTNEDDIAVGKKKRSGKSASTPAIRPRLVAGVEKGLRDSSRGTRRRRRRSGLFFRARHPTVANQC